MFKLEQRPQPSKLWTYAAPLLALAVTVGIGVLLFILLGKDPVKGLQAFFYLEHRGRGAICHRCGGRWWRGAAGGQEHGGLDYSGHFARRGVGWHGLGGHRGLAA